MSLPKVMFGRHSGKSRMRIEARLCLFRLESLNSTLNVVASISRPLIYGQGITGVLIATLNTSMVRDGLRYPSTRMEIWYYSIIQTVQHR